MAAGRFAKEQRDLLIKIIVFIIVIVVTSSITVYLSNIVGDSEKKHSWLKNDINDMERKLEGLNKKSLEFSEGVKAWEELSEEDKELPGLRINDAKDALDKLQEKYKFSSVKTSFSKPEEISGDYKTDTVGLISTIISMSFNTISDEYLYNFIGDLTKTFPGYVQVKSISVNKPAQINNDILKKISNGENVNIISVTMDFYWQDLKYRGAAATSPKPEKGAKK